jgi:hypothetical protein
VLPVRISRPRPWVLAGLRRAVGAVVAVVAVSGLEVEERPAAFQACGHRNDLAEAGAMPGVFTFAFARRD